MRPHRQVSAENRIVSDNLWAQNRLSKTKSPKLNTCEAFFFYAWYRNLVTRAQPHTWILFVNAFGKSHNINFVAISELPKTTRNISTFKTGESSSNYSENCRILHINRRWKLFSTYTVDLFKILVVNQRLKRRHGAPAFQTTFDEDFFGLVRDQHQFPSRRINFTPRTSFVRPKTFCCQQQSSQYPIFPSQSRDQYFIRAAKWNEIRDDVADLNVRLVPS